MSSLSTLNRLVRREQYMLNLFSNNLRTIIDRLIDNSDSSAEALQVLRNELDGEISWPVANRIEMALVEYYDETTLITEWKRRLAEVERLPQNIAHFYQQHVNESNSANLRALLARLVTDLQWSRESKRVIRVNEGLMRRKIVALFLFGFVLFFSPTIARLVFNAEFNNLRLYYIFTAASSGLLGATFSQLTTIQSRVQLATLDQVRAMSQLGYITARAMVGAGAGLIMFYLVQSGLLDGAFFPEFIHTVNDLELHRGNLSAATTNQVIQGVSQGIETDLAIGTLARPAQGLSLLIVWCILAGFSEKMIPGILNNKAKQAEEASKNG